MLTVSCPVRYEDEPMEEMRDITAKDLVAEMGVGVNIGNTFDSLWTTGISGETGWGNPVVSQAFIASLPKNGFKTVRLPVSWSDYTGEGPDYTIDENWMARVEEVVNWILAEDMYCVLNIHHDGGGEDTGNPNITNYPNKYWIRLMQLPDQEEAVNNRFAAVWKQIARRFAGKSDKLILEGVNEIGFDNLWNRYAGGQAEEKAKAYRLLNKLNQTFVNTVRSTGGNNAVRCLLFGGYWTDISQSCDPLFKIPEDTATEALILSVHYYTPWDFCAGNRTTWGNVNDVNELNRLFDLLKVNFINKNVPVILGEFAAEMVTGKDPESRQKWMTAVTRRCLDDGSCPVLWDTGMRANNQGMADLQRTSPFAISDDLKAMFAALK